MTDWLEEAEKRLDSELEISNEPDKIKVQLAKHKVPQAVTVHTFMQVCKKFNFFS